jgi:hypothetical protein
MTSRLADLRRETEPKPAIPSDLRSAPLYPAYRYACTGRAGRRRPAGSARRRRRHRRRPQRPRQGPGAGARASPPREIPEAGARPIQRSLERPRTAPRGGDAQARRRHGRRRSRSGGRTTRAHSLELGHVTAERRHVYQGQSLLLADARRVVLDDHAVPLYERDPGDVASTGKGSGTGSTPRGSTSTGASAYSAAVR